MEKATVCHFLRQARIVLVKLAEVCFQFATFDERLVASKEQRNHTLVKTVVRSEYFAER